MIVVDTNVIAYLLIAGDKTFLAQATFRQDNDWVVPSLWRHELLNVISMFIRHGGGQLEDGQKIWEQAVSLLDGKAAEVDMAAALTLSVGHGISAYDAQFVSLAIANKSPLITEDRKILHLFPQVALSMADFVQA